MIFSSSSFLTSSASLTTSGMEGKGAIGRSGTLITLELAPKGNWRHLRVRNSGTRLPEQFQDQLFDSLVSVREPGTQGTHLGLGLFIARGLAESVDGSLRYHDRDGGGAVFEVRVPSAGEHVREGPQERVVLGPGADRDPQAPTEARLRREVPHEDVTSQ